MNDDDCQAGGPGMTMLEVIAGLSPEQILDILESVRHTLRADRQTAEDFGETMFQMASHFEDKYLDQVERTRQANLAYEEILKLWTQCIEDKLRYKDALTTISEWGGISANKAMSALSGTT